MTSEPLGLVGLYFHTYHPDDGKLRYQGRIAGWPAPELLLVEHFEWLSGSHNGIDLIPVAEVVEGCRQAQGQPGAWRLFACADDMNAAYSLYDQRRRADRMAAKSA